LLLFVQDSKLNIEYITEVLMTQRVRALYRLTALKALLSLINESGSDESRLTLIFKSIGDALRPENQQVLTGERVQSYLEGVEATGTAYRLSLSRSYFAFVQQLTNLRPAPLPALFSLLDLCNLDLQYLDLREMHAMQLPSFISSLASFLGSNKALLSSPVCCASSCFFRSTSLLILSFFFCSLLSFL
jgi:hypothetical protein